MIAALMSTRLSSLPAAAGSAPAAAPALSVHGLAWRVALLLGLGALAWEWAGGDLWLAGLAGNAAGFPLRQHWLLAGVVHGGGRILAWALALALCLAVWWPVGVVRRLPLARRLQLAGGVLLTVALVSLLKQASPAACPWDLAVFGGTAQPVSHWRVWAEASAGRGGCFPAGHASGAFAFLLGWFVLRPVAPRAARAWLAAVLVLGSVFGLGQQWRGAHFMSHTLWTAWIAWVLAWALDTAVGRLLQRGAGTAA